MPEKISVNKAMDLKDSVFIDVRAPIEFEKDHILEAINVPILTDEEREIVGTMYKQVCQDKAIETGMKYYEDKIPSITKKVKPFEGKTLVVYCWRGGLRSKIMTTLFESLGFKAFQLKDGYKAYRASLLKELQEFKLKPKLYVLHGLTCTGKTALLQKLPNSVDLEGLACHRGSLYGAIGLKPRSQKMFDNLLLKRLKELNSEKFIFIEGESRRIGNLMLPEFLWKAMCNGENIEVVRDLDIRVKEMVKEYFLDAEIVKDIKEISSRLWKVISKAKKQEMLDFIDAGEFEKAAKILLVYYYDPLYDHSLSKLDYSFEVNCNSVSECVKELLEKVI
ncbi:tRNA 2-selenouridine(34) synthase MnmH [Candidatus Woesearchaeota archaeon]|jgi:tRNA 2-selenouridine synthase|nr:tRNA 2-selenouridine(34) synthase MnmH [Candidatus Woesearchaeota archaeon]MBT4110717.1 tRNA 2-selenouridine(34) synthase MnmH [Candidatus Woesearchaeota archaeon]MBT4336313.1 tRNA 2-selenouridine(34) synthase MnmH [Candidatus Woesearchaeota archaeon]MBT4469326.1 tRNA 2-selenouridine(34) synthase MnmH [Candidatus Woesearchaeota archaeon]MBT6743851.1 tRNA 2-selenouridine(34) synthase MnmH [Candidatus Woesearchaeota archaeon]